VEKIPIVVHTNTYAGGQYPNVGVVVDRICGREASTDVRSVQQEAGPEKEF
jgi:hypothetical protein